MGIHATRPQQNPALIDQDAGFAGTAATANIVVVDAILTPRILEENPGGDFSSFTPAEHLADGVVFLCSDAAAEMNGQRLSLTA